MPNPTSPTEITASAAPAEVQRVRIDPDGWTPAKETDAILLMDELFEAREHLAEVVKERLLAARVKAGKGEIAEAQLKLQAIPKVVDARKVLEAVVARAKKERRNLVEVLTNLISVGALSFGKTALLEYFSNSDLEQLCVDGDPKAPSMVILPATAAKAPSDPRMALTRLAAIARDKPNWFIVPEKRKKVEAAALKPKVHYV